MLDVPSAEPATMATLSDSRALFRRAILPSTSRPARLATPIRVPVASNSSTRKNTSTTFRKPIDSAPGTFSCRKVGAIDGGSDTRPPNLFPPKKKLRMVTTTMPIRIAPLTFRRSSVTISRKPNTAISACGLCRSPAVTMVAGLATTRPALFSAISARNRPMPTVMAVRSECGMPLTIISRNPSTLTSTNRQPEMNTAPSADCHGTPIPSTTA